MTATGSDGSADGLLAVDKSAGRTSHDVVQLARRALGVRRIGHTGTLDPFATGLLLLCVGRSTRLAEYFHLLPKSYHATLELGVETTTHDPEGEVVSRSDRWRSVTAEEMNRTLRAHRGALDQRPPAFSAKRIAGRRAYEAAREGRAVELEPERVRVEELTMLRFDPPRVWLSARVGTGTYMRALARDIGAALGCGAHLRDLRRTEIGPFSVRRALPDEKLAVPREASGSLTARDLPVRSGADEDAVAPDPWYSPAEALSWLPARRLTPQEAERVGHGASLPAEETDRVESIAPGRTLPVAMLFSDRLLAVGEREGERLRPRKVFHAC